MSDTEVQAGPELLELNARVAEKVMGWKPVQYPGGIYWDEGEQGPIPGGKFSPRFSGSFKPSTDPAADYGVLKVAREWPVTRRQAFCKALLDIWHERRAEAGYPSLGGILYEPGDYSRAALKAVEAPHKPGLATPSLTPLVINPALIRHR